MNKTIPYLLHKLLLSLLTLGGLLVLLFMTDPNKVALPVLIAPFILIGCLIYQITHAILMTRKTLKSNYAGRLLPLSLACLGVALLLLRSLHQLTIKDSLLVCGFALVFWLYVWRADFLHK